MNQSCRKKSLALCLLVLAAICNASCVSPPEHDTLIADLDDMAAFGSSAHRGMINSIRDRILEDPAGAASRLMPRLRDSGLNGGQLAVYVWALGVTEDARAIDGILAVCTDTESDLVRGNCYRALASIGGDRSGKFLLSALKSTQDSEMRFHLLNLLCQMQYGPALPETAAVLEVDPRQHGWQCIFVFGKMGDKAVPFLLKRIADDDRNVRANAIHLLGSWLIPPEAADAFRDRFWKEKETPIRGVLLNSLANLSPNLEAVREFLQEVADKETDDSLLRFSREILGNFEKLEEKLATFAAEKEAAPRIFEQEYQTLYGSAGRTGDYSALAKGSSIEDETRLKRLRERILQRDSDEAFYDYQKVNEIIVLNRWWEAQKRRGR